MGRKTRLGVNGSFGSTDSSKCEDSTKNNKSDNTTLGSPAHAKHESDRSTPTSEKINTQSNNSKSTSGIEKSLPSSQIVVCEEVFDEHSEPTDKGIYAYTFLLDGTSLLYPLN